MDCTKGNCGTNCSGYFATILTGKWLQGCRTINGIDICTRIIDSCVTWLFNRLLAKKLNLTTTDESGVLIVGGSRFAAELAQSVKETGNEVLLIDQSWAELSYARKLGLQWLHWGYPIGATRYHLDLTPYRYILAMTKTDTYNAHICADFAQDLGRDNLYQTAFQVGKDVKAFTITADSRYFHLPFRSMISKIG